MNQKVLLPLYYNPHPLLFVPFFQGYEVVFDDLEIFKRGTMRSRTRMLSSQGVKDLFVSIRKPEQNAIYSRIKLDPKGNWGRDHFRFLNSNYGKSAYFPFVQEELEKLYSDRSLSLVQLNFRLILLALRILRIRSKPELLSGLPTDPDLIACKEEKLLDLIPSKGNGESRFDYSYPQLFGKGFADDVGVLDLVLCQGPDGISHLSSISEQMGDFEGFCGKNF